MDIRVEWKLIGEETVGTEQGWQDNTEYTEKIGVKKKSFLKTGHKRDETL